MFLLLQALEGVREVRVGIRAIRHDQGCVEALFSVATGASVLGSCLLWNEREEVHGTENILNVEVTAIVRCPQKKELKFRDVEDVSQSHTIRKH